jgi:hypothetical protein
VEETEKLVPDPLQTEADEGGICMDGGEFTIRVAELLVVDVAHALLILHLYLNPLFASTALEINKLSLFQFE